MIAFMLENMAPLMFCGLIIFLLMGYPVAFSLGACGLFFGLVGIEIGVPGLESLMSALPLRIFGIMQNETLLAIPFFTFMGLILERSGMAEDLLDTVGQLFGPLRGGLAIAVVLVGAMLAATTGVVAASVISMGLISLPIMLRYGYDRRIASGVIAASGTLAQIIPPSLVLIVLADQLGRSVGDLYKGAFLPGFMLMSMYILFVVGVAIFRPQWLPALPAEARTIRESNGDSGLRSLGLLTLVSVGCALAFAHTRPDTMPRDELIVLSLCVGTAVAFVAAVVNKSFRLGLLSQMAERVTFVLIPPLGLIFLVLGTIFMGWATPTEGGAMGAMGGLLMAAARRRMSFTLLKQAMDMTMKLSTFVVFILIGATVFGLTFQGVDGPLWVEHLLSGLPGGQLGFLIVVNILVFFLAFFLDFFELSFIVVPLLAPVADKLGIDLVWFGVLLALNMQTSFMHPPFGFALFYLRSVAPSGPYRDKVNGRTIQGVKSTEIYWGSVPFILLQLVMVATVIAFPKIVTGGVEHEVQLDNTQVLDILNQDSSSEGWGDAPADAGALQAPAAPDAAAPDAAAPADPATAPAEAPPAESDADALKQLEEASKAAQK
ncbi:TRAP transporter large permease [Amphibiibacter pelophylacis]|uniref:TRAP transporter large permease subunit n=1 Tax=Amphibiibacter pelophylacis TaxID=1799477 RepID=A0ACC6NYW2_9BURK